MLLSLRRSIKERPLVPWFNDENGKHERRKAEKRRRRTKLDLHLIALKVKRNATSALMNKDRREFCSNFIQENNRNEKKLFTISKRLLNSGSTDYIRPTLHMAQFDEDIDP